MWENQEKYNKFIAKRQSLSLLHQRIVIICDALFVHPYQYSILISLWKRNGNSRAKITHKLIVRVRKRKLSPMQILTNLWVVVSIFKIVIANSTFSVSWKIWLSNISLKVYKDFEKDFSLFLFYGL